MTVQELSTIIRHKVDMVILLINNSGYSIERLIHGMEAQYNEVSQWRYHELPMLLGGAPENVDERTNKTTNETTNGTTNETTNETKDGTTDETTNETKDGTTDETTNEITDGTTDEVANGITNAITDGFTNGATDADTNEAINKATDAFTNEATNGVTHEATNGATNEATNGTTHNTEEVKPVEKVQQKTEKYEIRTHKVNTWTALCEVLQDKDFSSGRGLNFVEIRMAPDDCPELMKHSTSMTAKRNAAK